MVMAYEAQPKVPSSIPVGDQFLLLIISKMDVPQTRDLLFVLINSPIELSDLK